MKPPHWRDSVSPDQSMSFWDALQTRRWARALLKAVKLSSEAGTVYEP